jgi:hypothetical protein
MGLGGEEEPRYTQHCEIKNMRPKLHVKNLTVTNEEMRYVHDSLLLSSSLSTERRKTPCAKSFFDFVEKVCVFLTPCKKLSVYATQM